MLELRRQWSLQPGLYSVQFKGIEMTHGDHHQIETATNHHEIGHRREQGQANHNAKFARKRA